MSGKSFAWQGLAALILIGLLITGGLAVHSLAWSQGYGASQLTAEAEEAAASYLPYRRSPGFVHYRMFGAGSLFRFLCMAIFCIVIAKLFRFVFWGTASSSMMGGPGRWHEPYGRRE